jgi:hypothetical protein
MEAIGQLGRYVALPRAKSPRRAHNRMLDGLQSRSEYLKKRRKSLAPAGKYSAVPWYNEFIKPVKHEALDENFELFLPVCCV